MMDPNEFALGEREFERIRERLYDARRHFAVAMPSARW